MRETYTQEVTCEFTDKQAMDEAVKELRRHHFHDSEMGVEKIVMEYKSSSPQLDNVSTPRIVKRPWRIRDSLRDITEENSLFGLIIALIGGGFLAATTIATLTLDVIEVTQEAVLYMLLLGAALLAGGLMLNRLLIHEAMQLARKQTPKNILCFWVRTSDTASAHAIGRILAKCGAQYIHKHAAPTAL